MATRRRKVTEQLNPESTTTMEEELNQNLEEIYYSFEQSSAPEQPEQKETVEVITASVIKKAPEPVGPKRHPRNIPRFSRERA